MNEKAKTEKIKRFLADKEMAEYVKHEILATFLKKQANMDVHVLAAKSLAIDMLQDAYKNLERFQSSNAQPSSPGGQVGM